MLRIELKWVFWHFISSVAKINPTTELALFWRRVTILGFIYIYGIFHILKLAMSTKKPVLSNHRMHYFLYQETGNGPWVQHFPYPETMESGIFHIQKLCPPEYSWIFHIQKLAMSTRMRIFLIKKSEMATAVQYFPYPETKIVTGEQSFLYPEIRNAPGRNGHQNAQFSISSKQKCSPSYWCRMFVNFKTRNQHL